MQAMQRTFDGPEVPHDAVLAADARRAHAARQTTTSPAKPAPPPDLDPHPGQLSLLDIPEAWAEERPDQQHPGTTEPANRGIPRVS